MSLSLEERIKESERELEILWSIHEGRHWEDTSDIDDLIMHETKRLQALLEMKAEREKGEK